MVEMTVNQSVGFTGRFLGAKKQASITILFQIRQPMLAIAVRTDALDADLGDFGERNNNPAMCWVLDVVVGRRFNCEFLCHVNLRWCVCHVSFS